MNNDRATLDELANKYSTDKGTLYPRESRHGYAPFYDELLSNWRDENIRMLEVGICMEFTEGGQSVHMWHEYFTKAKIYTFDIVDMSEHPAIVNNDRVSFFRGDQGKREDFISMYEKFGNEQFDFILEDGSHRTEHQMISLAHLFKYVKSGGYYVLEDVTVPGRPACCIRNDDTFRTIDNFVQTQEFLSPYITDDEKTYLENNIEKMSFFLDVQGAYMTIVFYKK